MKGNYMTQNDELIHYESNKLDDSVSISAAISKRAKDESDKANRLLIDELRPVFETRKKLYDESKLIEGKLKEIKAELSMIDAELESAFQSAGWDDGEPMKFGGFRYSFVTERVGAVAVGKEAEAVQRAKELGLEGLVKVSIPKMVLKAYEGNEMDGLIEINEYQKFKVLKDTSKKGGS